MPRVSRPWFRFYTEAFSDRKMRRLTPAQRWLWVAILGAARESPEPGLLMISADEPMTMPELAEYAGVKERDVEPALRLMESLGMVEGRDPIMVTNFSHRQFESDDVTARVRAFRERSMKRPRNVTWNVSRGTGRNGPETETETEAETDHVA